MSEKATVVDAEFTPKAEKSRLENLKQSEPKGLLKPLMIFAVCVGIALFGFSTGLDNDIWFMIAHGNYLFENGFHFPSTEILSIHSDFAFSLEKWASCVLFAGAYNLFGEWGVLIFSVIVFALVLYLIYRAALVVSEGNFWVSILGTALCGLPLAISWARTRPQIFSYMFLILEFIVLEKFVQTKKEKYLWFLPLISCLLIQFHSTMWVMFLIVLMPYIFLQIKVGRFVPDKGYKPMTIFKYGVISILTALINPYGLVSVSYLFNSIGAEGMHIISELQPMTWNWLAYFVPSLLFIVLWLKTDHKKEVPVRYLWFILGTAVMSLTAIRNISYYILFSMFMPIYMWKDTKIGAQNITVIAIILFGLLGGSYIFYDNNTKEGLTQATPCASIVDEFAEMVEDPGEIKL